mmetsp:Transcript_121209/g.354293  ORF Transcript_121209/g.354293 Transcript_121209/m.354293 type:complete len:207 (+) Transcript_121209:767-1387(+)
MCGSRAVTMPILLCTISLQCSSFAVMPCTHFSRKTFRPLVNTRTEVKSLYMTIGSMTLSSSCPASAPKATVKSLPSASKQHMFMTSGMTGFTFPGMIEEPGAMGGRLISERPQRGPEARSLRSLQIFETFTATRRRMPEKNSIAPREELDSIRSSAKTMGKPVTSRSTWTTVCEKWGSAAIPVPMAVPPKLVHMNRLIAFLTDSKS